MDDAEIVGDSVAEPLPLSGHGMPEKLDDLAAELGEGLVVPDALFQFREVDRMGHGVLLCLPEQIV
jgi:hypothetical protein